ncbi:hypothetical protein Mal48_02440 [Thalassoglobus polymorphus]|uniref:Uncharacterized protein n=1 Tax=Thalassoglobus polymorphus TaxID=2527994 RepID=A0A517QHA0_9PLAN|nr:hypothetical protein Mal48_02440 [Thalassoglobus polymorphus]
MHAQPVNWFRNPKDGYGKPETLWQCDRSCPIRLSIHNNQGDVGIGDGFEILAWDSYFAQKSTTVTSLRIGLSLATNA